MFRLLILLDRLSSLSRTRRCQLPSTPHVSSFSARERENGRRLWPATVDLPGTCPESVCRREHISAHSKQAIKKTAGQLGMCRKRMNGVHRNMRLALLGYTVGNNAARDVTMNSALSAAFAAAAASDEMDVAKRNMHRETLIGNGQLPSAIDFHTKVKSFERCWKAAEEALDKTMAWESSSPRIPS